MIFVLDTDDNNSVYIHTGNDDNNSVYINAIYSLSDNHCLYKKCRLLF